MTTKDKTKGISAEKFKEASEQQLKDQGLLSDLPPEAENIDTEIPEGRFSEKIIYQALEENEDGDAALFIKLFKGKRLYDQRANPNAAWFYWNDHYWREDEQKEVFSLVKDVVAIYYEQRQREGWKVRKLEKGGGKLSQEERAAAIADCKSRAKQLHAREMALQTLKRKSNVLRLASMGVNSLGYVGDGWDQNPWLLGCRNGVIDLKKGVCRPGRPDDFIRTVCPVKWDESATCPTWEKFLYDTFDGDQALIDFLQRLLGYSITGLREEHIYPIFWGPHGRNGKGTIFETLKLILEAMAYRAPTSIVMQGLQHKSTGPNSTLMKFRGARVVWTSEANKKDHLDTAIIKGLSGGDTITARNPYDRKDTDFPPSHTIFTVVNPLPRVDADDDAFWDRAIIFPFLLSFVENPVKPWERKRDPKLGDKLARELPGILRWLVEGTQLWTKQGLDIPEKLTAAKCKYRDDEDIIGHFIKECLEINLSKNEFMVKPKKLFHTYVSWCKDAEHKPLNQKHFHEAIQQKIDPPSKYAGVTYYKGLLIIPNAESGV